MSAAIDLRKYSIPEAERADMRAEAFYDRLVFQYGPDRTDAIMDGRDAATRADLAKWRALGAGQ